MKKTPRLSARRVLQGGTAFAALGALTLMAASPAHADTYGWAYANALGAEQETSTYVTKDQTVSGSFEGAIGSWLTVNGTTTATVNADGATGTAVVDTARIVITEDDLPGILDPEDEEEEDAEEDDTDDDTDDGDDDNGGEGDSDDETPGDSGDDQGGDATPGDGNSGGSDDSTGTPAEPGGEPTDDPSDEPSASPSADDDDEVNETASADVIELDDENSELANNGGEVLLEATITGASVSTSQSWDGAVNHGFNPGSLDDSNVRAMVDDEEVELVVELLPAEAVFESEDAGFTWNDAITDMYITFSVGDEVVAGYLIAESAAGITTGAVDGGGDNGGGDGDGKNPPEKERDKDTLPKTEVKDAEPLAQTGSPLAGLIAAGAAIAAGGGAAAYLARRKKKNGEETAETDES